MPRRAYKSINLKPASRELLEVCREVIREYRSDGLKLSLRQLYYQLVSEDVIPNDDKEYKKLGALIGKARLIGEIDWDAIEDRNREPDTPAEFDSLSDLIEAAINSYRLPRCKGQTYYCELWCFPAGTPVVSERGAVSIEDVMEGDRVLTVDGSYRHVVEAFSRECSEELVEIRAVGLLPTKATRTHPVYSRRWDKQATPHAKGAQRKFGSPDYVSAGDLNKFDRLMLPRVKEVRDVTQVTMPGGPRSRQMKLPLSYDFLSVLGAYLADGSVKGDGRTVQFVLGSRNARLAETVEEWAHAVGFNTWRSTNSKGTTIVIYVYSRTLALWLLDHFGTGAFQKKMPLWLLFLPQDKQHTVLKSYFTCDGSKPSESEVRIAVSTRSRSLALQTQIILNRLGFGAALGAHEEKGEPMYRVGVSGEYGRELADRWGFDTSPWTSTFNHIQVEEEWVEYPIKSVVNSPNPSGRVWNLTVEGNNSYCVPFVVHNCEKAALANVLLPLARDYHATLMVNRGYSSLSAMYESARRIDRRCRHISPRGGYDSREGDLCVDEAIILYLGDLDPSGEDMVRDIEERLTMFLDGGVSIDSEDERTETPDGWNVEFVRPVPLTVEKIALTMDQVREYQPPPNPAKRTDSRSKEFMRRYGASSWEVDALRPNVLRQIIRDAFEEYMDLDRMQGFIDQEEVDKAQMRELQARSQEE